MSELNEILSRRWNREPCLTLRFTKSENSHTIKSTTLLSRKELKISIKVCALHIITSKKDINGTGQNVLVSLDLLNYQITPARATHAKEIYNFSCIRKYCLFLAVEKQTCIRGQRLWISFSHGLSQCQRSFKILTTLLDFLIFTTLPLLGASCNPKLYQCHRKLISIL